MGNKSIIDNNLREFEQKYLKIFQEKKKCIMHPSRLVTLQCKCSYHQQILFYCKLCTKNYQCKLKMRQEINRLAITSQQGLVNFKNKIIQFLDMCRSQNQKYLIDKIEKECLSDTNLLFQNGQIKILDDSVISSKTKKQKQIQTLHYQLIQIKNIQNEYQGQSQIILAKCITQIMKILKEMFNIDGADILYGPLLKKNKQTVQDLLKKCDKQGAEIKKLSTDLQYSQKNNKQLQKELDNFNKKSFHSQQSSMIRDRFKTSRTITQMNDSIINLGQKQLEQKINQMKKELEQKNSKISSLISKLSKRKKKQELKQKEFQFSINQKQEKINTLEKQLRQQKVTQQIYREKIKLNDIKFDTLNKQHTQIHGKYFIKCIEAESLQKKIKKLEQRIKEIQILNKQIKNKNDELSTKIHGLQNQLKKNSQNLVNKSNQVMKLERQLEELMTFKQLQSKKKICEVVQSENDRKIQNLKKDIEGLRQQLRKSVIELQYQKKRYQSVQNEYEKLKKQSEQDKIKIQNLNKKIEELYKDLEQIDQKYRQSKQIYSSNEFKIKELQNDHKNCNSNLKSKSNQLVILQQKIKKIEVMKQERIKQLLKQLNQYQSQITKLKKNHQHQIQQLRLINESKNNNEPNLIKELQSKSKLITQHQAKIAQLLNHEKKLQEIQNQLQKKSEQNKKQSLLFENKCKSAQITLRNIVEESESKKKVLTQLLEQEKSRYKNLQQQYNLLKAKSEEDKNKYQSKIDKLNKQLQMKQQQLGLYNEKIKQYTSKQYKTRKIIENNTQSTIYKKQLELNKTMQTQSTQRMLTQHADKIKNLQSNLKEIKFKLAYKSSQVARLEKKLIEQENQKYLNILQPNTRVLQAKLKKYEQIILTLESNQKSKQQHMMSLSDFICNKAIQQSQQKFKITLQKNNASAQMKLNQVRLTYQNKISILQTKIRQLQEELSKRIITSRNKSNLIIDTKLLDESQIQVLLQMIRKRIKFIQLQLIFVASQHEFSSQKFHKICDNKPRLVVIAKSVNGKIFGGYCSPGFGQQQKDDPSFIFSITHKIDLSLQKGKKSTVLDRDYGPIFGTNSDIKFRLNIATSNYFIVNNSYEKKSDLPVPAKELLCGARQAEIIDYQVHYIIITQN